MIVDLHSHLLPGVDDGAQTLEASIELARLGEAEGIQDLVLTPHHRNGQYINRAETVLQATDQLQAAYQEAGLALRVYPSQEIRLTEDFWTDYYNGDLLSLDGEGWYYLIEFPSHTVPDWALDSLEELVHLGATPVIAHPERNKAFREDFDLLADFIEAGCLSQLTAASYVGAFGDRFRETSLAMVRQGLAHIIASDVHHKDHRPFRIQAAYRALEADFGRDVVDQFQAAARQILRGEAVDRRPVVRTKKTQQKRKWFFGLF